MIGAGLAKWEDRGEMHRVEVIVFELSASSLVENGHWGKRQHPDSVKAEIRRDDRRKLIRVKKALN